jgi:hypothetical protein
MEGKIERWGWVAGAFLLITIVCSILFVFVGVADEEPPPIPIPPTGATVQKPPPAFAPIDPLIWKIVEDLTTLEGHWEGSHEGEHVSPVKVQIQSRKSAKKAKRRYRSIYPWRLDYKHHVEGKHPLNCGIYPDLKEPPGLTNWRLAMCVGYAIDPKEGAYANRLMFHVKHSDRASMRLQVGNMIEIYLKKAKKP